MALMEYENQMFLDAFHDDALTIAAKGLGIERVFLSFVKLYSDPQNLVLVLNTTTQEEEYFLEKLQEDGVRPMPRVLTTQYNANERNTIYMEGGVIFVTSRILVVDMLTDKIPIHLITGILVYKAHKIIESCQEAFILRLYRQKNKTGFVKAFSDSSLSFTAGFCHVERVMKSLFVKKLFLWPRFQASVVAYLNKHKVDVVEMHVQMTDSMVSCQTALLDLIDVCVKELKRGNPTLDTDEITVENAISRGFDKLVRLHLDPVWHQLSGKTKQLVADIKTLKAILEYLTQHDCVNFYNLVQSIRTNEKIFGTNSGWLFMDAADSLFMHAKDRIHGSNQVKKQKTSDKKSSNKESKMLLEECPKWTALKAVLDEIQEQSETMKGSGSDDTQDTGSAAGTGPVLICAADDRTCNQIKEFLCEGSRPLLQRLYEKTVAIKTGASKEQTSNSGFNKFHDRNKDKGGAPKLTLTQMMAASHVETDQMIDSSEQTLEGASASYIGVLKDPLTILHPLYGCNDPFSLIKTLHELQPTYVVLYDADMTFVRQLEVYRASRPGRPLRVYFMMYTGSTEEQRYLTSLRKEKEAFEYLIKTKATMVIPEEREGKTEDDPSLSRDTAAANATVSTRRGGRQETPVQHKVIVDMREFRSELPSLIHRRGIDIEPVTIDIGDYILTPDICVERKSLSDLIGSLNNGRLYNQCVSMCRYYTRPVLLIEFDPQKPFSLQGKYSMSAEISSQDTMSKLTLLTISFPRLRILWCQSPYATAELFEEIKQGREQPSAEAAIAISGNKDDEVEGKYSLTPQEMLLKMPGITSKNIFKIMNKVESIAELVTLTLNEIKAILESESHAKQLHTFLHSKQNELEGQNPSSNSGPNKPRVPKYFNKGAKRKT